MDETQEKPESSKPFVMNLRELLVISTLFVILFGGFAVTGGFLMGIFAAKSFIHVYNDQQPTTKALTFCEEMISAYKGRDALQIQENEELQAVVNRYSEFLADNDTTVQMKKSMGGSSSVKK